MAEGENILRELHEAKSRIEEQVTYLVKDFLEKFPKSELYINIEYTYKECFTRCKTHGALCKLEVKAGVIL